MTPAARARWVARNRYYHASLARLVQHLISPRSTVLQVQAGLGELIGSLKDVSASGTDSRPQFVAAAAERYPHVAFRLQDVERAPLTETYDCVILSDVLGSLRDVQTALANVRPGLHEDSRLVLTYYNYLWDPILKVGQMLGLKMPQHQQNWLPLHSLDGILHLADLAVVERGHRLLIPKRLPVVAEVANRFLAPLPLVRNLCLIQYVVAAPAHLVSESSFTCSVIVPCRNEAGTIPEVVERVPSMGRHTEIVFVEGHSKDDTLAACYRVQAEHPDRDIKVVRQDGIGKGDAVRRGFEVAQGDVLMILDADLTTPPEDLPKFFAAMATGKGDLVIGTRLIYPMEYEAMRFLNLLANRAFGILFSYLLGQPITDALCGTKALTRVSNARIAAQRSTFGESDPFGDFDLLLGAARLHLRILEVPVRYAARSYGSTNIQRFKHGWLLLKMAWRAMQKLRFVS